MIDDIIHAHIESFINTFISNNRRSRWRTIFNMNPKHWNKISAWDLWDDRYSISKYCSEWKKSIDELFNFQLFVSYAERKVIVVHFGHDKGKVERLSLREALVGEKSLFEGIISIVPGVLVLAVNHDGGICVCQNPPKMR